MHLLRSVLPRSLTAPIPYSANRQADHDVLADQLFGAREIKRQVAAEKRKAKKGPEGEGSSQRIRLDLLHPTELVDMDTS
jgi:hypothetical protein